MGDDAGPYVSDARLRDLERRWKETGSADDEAAYLVERMRLGLLERVTDVSHLPAIARAIEAAGPRDIVVEVDAAAPGFVLDDAAGDVLGADLARLDLVALVRAYPREDDGRLPLGEAVLLASYPCSEPMSRGRAPWLTACAPAKRREPQVITIRLLAELADNRPHRWNEDRHLWDDRVDPPADDTDLGTLALLDAGRFVEALARHGVTLSEEVQAVLRGESSRGEAWAAALRRALAESAPWRMARCRKRARLFCLPGQTHASKTSLFLAPASSRVALELESTANNQRLAETLWKRPQEVDLRRCGLLPPADLRPAPAPARDAPPAPPPDRVTEVFELLAQGTQGGQRKAHLLAKRLGPSALAPRFTAALADPALRGQVLPLIAEVRVPVALDALLACLADPVVQVRMQVVIALTREVAPLDTRLDGLARALADASPQVRRYALDAFTRLGGPDERLLRGLADPDDHVRRSACALVARRKLRAAIPRLLGLARGLGGSSVAAIDALGELRAQEAAPLLVDLLRSAVTARPDSRTTRVCEALTRIEAPDAFPLLVELYGRTRERRALDALVAHGVTSAVPRLRELAAATEHPPFREAVERGIAAIEAAASRPKKRRRKGP